MKFRIYGHFSYMVNFTRTKPWTIYPEPSVILNVDIDAVKSHDNTE